jgi:hypothetical protein
LFLYSVVVYIEMVLFNFILFFIIVKNHKNLG